MTTPLEGGDAIDMTTSDFAGVTPRNQVAATPNPLLAAATPARGGAGGVAATPGMVGMLTGRRDAGKVVAGVASTPLLAAATPGRAGQVGATPLQVNTLHSCIRTHTHGARH